MPSDIRHFVVMGYPVLCYGTVTLTSDLCALFEYRTSHSAPWCAVFHQVVDKAFVG